MSVLLAAVVFGCAAVLLIFNESGEWRYIAASGSSGHVYTYNEYEKRLFLGAADVPRGSRVYITGETYTENSVEYSVIQYNGETYYTPAAYLAESPADTVLESELWVKTSSCLFREISGAGIAAFVKKGERVDVTGYDTLNPDGTVKAYRVSAKGSEGWISASYVTDSKDDALEIYHPVYAIHSGREYTSELYSGSTKDLDWFPVEKKEFENNPVLTDLRGMYICESALPGADSYVSLAGSSGINAAVIDIKDGTLLCPFEAASEYAPETRFLYSASDASAFIGKLRDAGLYIILRINVFEDEAFAKAHPEEAISSDLLTEPVTSPYSRLAWEYNVSLALEAVEKFSPDEIMFDQVRFPVNALELSEDPSTDFGNTYDEGKGEAIQNFVRYACDVIHQREVYVSVMVSEYCVSKYITAAGQYLPAISNIADAVCPTPFIDNGGNSEEYWEDAYTIISTWAERCAARQSETESPALCRVWLTGADIPYWKPVIEIDSDYADSEIRGLRSWGLDDGYMFWNDDSDIEIYQKIKSSWSY